MDTGAHPIELLEVDIATQRFAALARLKEIRTRAFEVIGDLHEQAEICKSLGVAGPAQDTLQRVRAIA
jgi:hypothetical protein